MSCISPLLECETFTIEKTSKRIIIDTLKIAAYSSTANFYTFTLSTETSKRRSLNVFVQLSKDIHTVARMNVCIMSF